MAKKQMNDNNIEMYLHCGLCFEEWQKVKDKISPQDFQKTQCGWTKQGLQVWCTRHECNILHIDFEGVKHKADITRRDKNGKKDKNL